MKITVVCSQKSIGIPGLIGVNFTAKDGHGSHQFYLKPEEAQAYELGAEYTVTIEKADIAVRG